MGEARRFNFAGVQPAKPLERAEPREVSKPGLVVWAGPSSFGSHAVRSGLSCPTQFALSFGVQVPGVPPSDGSGRVGIYVDPGEVLLQGPLSLDVGEALAARAQSIYMLRGSLVHVALAHELINLSFARGEGVLVGGRPYEPGTPFYNAEDAIELVSTLIGSRTHAFALPTARRMLSQIKDWSAEIIEEERVIGIETQLGWHINGPWMYTARFDLLTSNRVSGLIKGTDYKSSMNPSRDKAKYELSGQLLGQDQMGVRWLPDRWGGVRVLMVEDTRSEKPGSMASWMLPPSFVTRSLEETVARAQNNVAPYVGRPLEQWPVNPFACDGCRAKKRCHGK